MDQHLNRDEVMTKEEWDGGNNALLLVNFSPLYFLISAILNLSINSWLIFQEKVVNIWQNLYFICSFMASN